MLASTQLERCDMYAIGGRLELPAAQPPRCGPLVLALSCATEISMVYFFQVLQSTTLVTVRQQRRASRAQTASGPKSCGAATSLQVLPPNLLLQRPQLLNDLFESKNRGGERGRVGTARGGRHAAAVRLPRGTTQLPPLPPPPPRCRASYDHPFL